MEVGLNNQFWHSLWRFHRVVVKIQRQNLLYEEKEQGFYFRNAETWKLFSFDFQLPNTD